MPKIDKSVLAIGTRLKVQDRQYLDSYKDAVCQAGSTDIRRVCGKPAIGAHCRAREYAGMGTKPSDDLTWPLCHEHHMDQEANPGPEWWLENVLKPMMRRRYWSWKDFKESRKK